MFDLIALGHDLSSLRLAVDRAGDRFLRCTIIEVLNFLVVSCFPVDENADTDEEIVGLILGNDSLSHAVGPAQHAVAKAGADCVAEGVIPQDEADNLFICVGVFIHWEAADDKKIQDFNYQAVKEAIARAVNGEPKAAEVVAKRNQVKHPFAAA